MQWIPLEAENDTGRYDQVDLHTTLSEILTFFCKTLEDRLKLMVRETGEKGIFALNDEIQQSKYLRKLSI